MKPTRWLLPQQNLGSAETLASSLDICPPAARVLVNRGYGEAADARRFLYPSLDDLYDPFLLLGMREALARLRRAIERREKILLYGDYDVDGATAVAVLKKAIELAGGDASWYIPNRLKDGYGLQPEVIGRSASAGVNLLISLDTGIRAAEAVCAARRVGIDVIITDHHLPDDNLPQAVAVLNPKQPGCPYPDKDLCGAGVAFKLVQALMATLDWRPEKVRRMTESFLKLVAIGTVADVVPLVGENRVFVRHGLAGLAELRSPGLRELMKVAGFNEGDVPTAGQIAFRIAPRMNAAGRMADAGDVISLLLTSDAAKARQIAEQLHALNLERQAAEKEIVELIEAECLEAPVTDLQAALVFAGKDWHRGVVGIVANRLVERYHRPVFVLSEDAEQGLLQGSGRSVGSFHLLAALESMAELFTRFGGHRQAAGLSLRRERLEEFRERFNAYAAARLAPEDFVQETRIDSPLTFQEITERSIADVLSMAPFGCGNPAPVFMISDVEVAGTPVVWKDRHLRLNLRQNGRTLMLKAWDAAARAGEFAPGTRLDAAITFEQDSYALSRGYPGWCATLKDARPAL